MGKHEHDTDGASAIIKPGDAAVAALAFLSARARVQTAGAVAPPGVPPGAASVWNPNAGPTWGAPISERVSAEGTSRGNAAPGAAAQESSSAWGRQVTVNLGQNPQSAIRVFLEESTNFTLSVDVLQEAQATIGIIISRWYCWALVTVGNGSTNVQRKVRCDYRIDLPLAGSYVDVLIFVGDAKGNPVDPATIESNQAPAIAVCQLSRGIRGLPYSASRFVTGVGTASDASTSQLGDTVIDEPARLMSVSAHLVGTSNGPRYLQFFDRTSSTFEGGTPLFEWVLGSTPNQIPPTRFLNPAGFVSGIYWALSSTGGVYTEADDTDAWVEIEQQLI